MIFFITEYYWICIIEIESENIISYTEKNYFIEFQNQCIISEKINEKQEIGIQKREKS